MYIFANFLFITSWFFLFFFITYIFLEESVRIDRNSAIVITVSIVAYEIVELLGVHFKNDGVRLVATLGVFLIFLSLYFRGGIRRLHKRLIALGVCFFTFWQLTFLYYQILIAIFNPFAITSGNDDDSLSFLIVNGIIYTLIIIYLYTAFYRKRIRVQFRIRDIFLLYTFVLVLSFLSEEIENLAMKGERLTNGYNTIVFILSTLLAFAGPIYIIKNRLAIRYEIDAKHSNEIVKLELEHFNQYKATQEETRRFRHDIINHLMAVQMLLKEGKNEQSAEYVESLVGSISALSPSIVTGSDLLDCIVSSKFLIMDEYGISHTLDGVLDAGINLKPIDVCTIFANAMDNAIEALKKLDGSRTFSMKLRRTQAFYYISMSNNMQTEGKTLIGTKRFTTKSDSSMHGYGLGNIKKAVEQYGGSAEIEIEEGIFTLNIILPIQ